MSESQIKSVLINIIKELEISGDIIVVNPTEDFLADKIFSAVQKYSANMVSSDELSGIINAVNAHKLSFKLDDNDFKMIIGLTEVELDNAVSKLKNSEL
jgi:hypothetical protein